jgi:hypothetical protein
MKRRLGMLLVLAVIGVVGVVVGVAIGGATRPARRAAALRAPTVRAAPATTCFVAGSAGCSINPCHEFVTSAGVPRLQCDAYPSPRARAVLIGQ